jgi:hypothetical protein
MGVCHFPSFRAAMETTRHLVALGPTAVELVDNNVLTLGADIPLFRRTLARITRGAGLPAAGRIRRRGRAALEAELGRLDTCMSDHGFPEAVVRSPTRPAQREVWEMREACLNIMMSTKGDAKPVSFIEDCAVPLEHLADYTDAITELFARHGTRGTWYAHASVGCLHVRPILDMKDAGGLRAMRAIAEEACALVRRFEGSHSGEHGDGISRSEFHEAMFGPRLVRAFEAVKDAFDPEDRLNPGKIVRPFRMDEPALMRFAPGYAVTAPARPALDWSDWGGFGGAVEMCNNNGTCRKLAGGAMCPSYRVTRDEQHLTRGPRQQPAPRDLGPARRRRLPLRGDEGDDGALRRLQGLPPRMPDRRRHGADEDRVPAPLPRAPRPAPARAAGRLAAALCALRRRLRGARQPARPCAGLPALGERLLGLAAARPLPVWRAPWAERGGRTRPPTCPATGATSCSSATPSTATSSPRTSTPRAACSTRAATGCTVPAAPGGRPLCCGRTFLAAGLVDEARAEARRTLDALAPARRARRPDRRARALVPAHLPRRVRGAPAPREVAPLAEARSCWRRLLAADLDGRAPNFRSPTPAAGSPTCTAIATRRPSASWARSSGCSRRARPRGPSDRVELLRHGRRLRPPGRDAGHLARDGRGSRSCRRCARRDPTISCSPTASAAGARSRTAPAAARSTYTRRMTLPFPDRRPPERRSTEPGPQDVVRCRLPPPVPVKPPRIRSARPPRSPRSPRPHSPPPSRRAWAARASRSARPSPDSPRSAGRRR